jgi:hypothetical protein
VFEVVYILTTGYAVSVYRGSLAEIACGLLTEQNVQALSAGCQVRRIVLLAEGQLIREQRISREYGHLPIRSTERWEDNA